MILYGAGGQAKVIYDLILSNNQLLDYLVDDHPHDNFPHNLKIYPPSRELIEGRRLIIAIGDNRIREKIYEQIKDWCEFESIHHPGSHVSRFSEVGCGTVIMPQACINADVKVGNHCIINTASTIEHDCQIGDFAHISPKASLAGNITVEKGAHIGIGACIIQGVTIGEGAVVGAGTVVLKDVPAWSVVAGNPGRILKTLDATNKI